MAVNCGFDAVKFQKRTIEKFIQKKFLINIEKVLGEVLKENKNLD